MKQNQQLAALQNFQRVCRLEPEFAEVSREWRGEGRRRLVMLRLRLMIIV